MRWSYPALFAIYEDPVFQKDYAPGLVPLRISEDYHAIFVRSGTSAARPPREWTE